MTKNQEHLLARIFNKIHLTLITLLVFACCVVIFPIHCELRVEGVRKNRWNHHNVGWVVPLEYRDTQCWAGAVFLGKSKSGFPNPNTDFAGFWANPKTDHESIKSTLWVDSSDQIQIRIFETRNLSVFWGKDLKTVFCQAVFRTKMVHNRFRNMYDILTERVYVAGALTLSH